MADIICFSKPDIGAAEPPGHALTTIPRPLLPYMRNPAPLTQAERDPLLRRLLDARRRPAVNGPG